MMDFRFCLVFVFFVFEIAASFAAESSNYSITVFSEPMFMSIMGMEAIDPDQFILTRKIKSFSSDIDLPKQNKKFHNYTDLISGLLDSDLETSRLAANLLIDNYIISKIQTRVPGADLANALINIVASDSEKIQTKLYTDSNFDNSPLPLFVVSNESNEDVTSKLANKLPKEIIEMKYEQFFETIKAEAQKDQRINDVFKVCEKYRKEVPSLTAEIVAVKEKIFKNENYTKIHRTFNYLHDFVYKLHKSLYLINPHTSQTESHNTALFSSRKVDDTILASLIPTRPFVSYTDEDKQKVIELRKTLDDKRYQQTSYLLSIRGTEHFSEKIKTALMGFVHMFNLSIPNPYQ